MATQNFDTRCKAASPKEGGQGSNWPHLRGFVLRVGDDSRAAVERIDGDRALVALGFEINSFNHRPATKRDG